MNHRLLLFCIVLSLQLSAQSEKAFDAYALGLRAYYAGNYDDALKNYNDALQIKPTHTGFLYNRGLCYVKMGNQNMARFDFRKIVSIDSNYVEAWNQLALLAAAEKKYDDALEMVNHALRVAPNNINALAESGLLYYYQRKNEYALQAFSHAIEVSPEDDQLYYKRGLVYMNQENFLAAIKDFSKAYEMDQTNTLAQEQRATCYWKANNLTVACREWNELLKKGVQRVQSNIASYCQ